jgi:flagellar hook protein FlgE
VEPPAKPFLLTGALGVNVDQNASNIQVGRYSISATDGSVVNATFDTATRYMGVGDNGLMGVGASKNDTVFETARGLALNQQALPVLLQPNL